MKLSCVLLNWLLRANVTEGNYKCHLAIGLFAKYSVVFTTRRKDIRGYGRRGYLNCCSYKKILIKFIKSLNWPQLYPLWSVALFLSIPSSLFLGVFSLHVQLLLFFSLFCCSPLLTCLTNSPEMNRVKLHHYVCVTGLIINSLSTLLLFFNFIFHDLPHGVHIVISGERERSTKDKTQEKWRSSRKERIPLTCHQSYHPSLFSHAVYFFLHDSHITLNGCNRRWQAHS